MDNSEIQLVGSPCGQHGPYTFYKAFKYVKNGAKRIMTLSEFFFVKLWMDSDLVCIGELQLLWVDKNSEQVLASLRLYFLPENTPEGRMDHGEDEVLAISEKVVLRVEDLITWITMDAEWSWGRFVKSLGTILDYCTRDILVPTTLTETSLDFSDVQKEKLQLDNDRKHRPTVSPTSANTVPNVVVLSYPRYCRYRAIMRRLDGVADITVRHQVVTALGGHGTAGGGAVTSAHNTRVLFCKDTFDYPELEGHELLCNHLAPKLKGRPRGKRKKRSISPGGSESNESEESSSVCGGGGGSSSKVMGKITTQGGRNGLRCDTTTSPRRSTRSIENMESKNFLKKLTSFMKSNRTPMGRIPSLGYKELDLYGFYNKVQKLGGYDAVTSNRMWKSIFDDLSLSGASTSAATVIRRHYERFLLAYERKQKGEEYKPLPVSERRRLKSKAGSSSASDVETSEGTSRSGNSTPVPQLSGTSSNPSTPTDNKEFNISKSEVKTSSLRSVRVKSERMRDTTTATIKDKPSLEKSLSIEEQPVSSTSPTSPSKTDLSLTTTESTHLLLPPPPRPVFEDSKETIKDIHDRHNSMDCHDITNRKDTDDFTNLTNSIDSVECNDVKLKTENMTDVQFSADVKYLADVKGLADVKALADVKFMTDVKQDVKETKDTKDMKPLSMLVEKHCEPVTTAIAPVQKPATELLPNSPPAAEGKENIPLFNSSLDDEDLIEVPYKPETPEIIDLESDEFVSKTPTMNVTTELKRGKLEILKEGGLEVTPVKQLHFTTPPLSVVVSQSQVVVAPTTMTTSLESPFMVMVDDSRPSVIRQANSPQQISISMTAAEKRKVPMPPPPTTINATLIKKPRTPTPPVRTGITPPPPHQAASPKAKFSPASHHTPPSFNEHTPPKVIHQSKSIYSPHERTVYGDPKLLFPPSPITHHNTTTSIHTPKLPQPKQVSTVDILDLTLRSPQKPTVEITRVSNVPALPLHGAKDVAATTKGLYKVPQHHSHHLQQQQPAMPLPDVSRFGSNLEITLVAGNQSKKQSSQPSTKHSSNSKNSYHKPPSHVNNHKRSHSESSTGGSGNKHGRMMFEDTSTNTNGRRSHQNNDIVKPSRNSSKTTQNRNLEINIPNPYANRTLPTTTNHTSSSTKSSGKSDNRTQSAPSPNNKTPNNKTPNNSTSYAQQHPMFPPYMTQTSSNGKSANTQQGLPANIMDSMYYQQLLQNWYQPNAGLPQSMQPPGMFQMPTAEHMQLYNNLIAYNARIRMPFPMMDGNNASIMNSDSALNKQ